MLIKIHAINKINTRLYNNLLNLSIGSVLFFILFNFYLLLLRMHSISLEIMPYLFIDVFYVNNSDISILKCEINGTRIFLNKEQTQSVIDEIKFILEFDF